MENGTCYLLTVHGSRHPGAREAAARFEAFLQDQGLAHPARVCFLRMSEPSLADSLERAGAEGVTRIILVPLFVFPGQHLDEEIPELVARFQQNFPRVTVEVFPALAEIPAFGRWVASVLRELPEGRRRPWLGARLP